MKKGYRDVYKRQVCEVTPNVIMDKFDEQICTIIFVTDMTKEY